MYHCKGNTQVNLSSRYITVWDFIAFSSDLVCSRNSEVFTGPSEVLSLLELDLIAYVWTMLLVHSYKCTCTYMPRILLCHPTYYNVDPAYFNFDTWWVPSTPGKCPGAKKSGVKEEHHGWLPGNSSVHLSQWDLHVHCMLYLNPLLCGLIYIVWASFRLPIDVSYFHLFKNFIQEKIYKFT